MTEDQVTYQMIRAVRDETGASHEECRQALEESGGDVARAAALWFARKRQGATSGRSPQERPRENEPQSERSSNG
jgi:translation elongation factor EF-Ts